MLEHEKEGHDVKSFKKFNAAFSNELESLLKEASTKTETLKDYIASLDEKQNESIKHIEGIKAEVNELYQQALKKLNESKSFTDKKCDHEIDWVRNKFDRMKVDAEKQRACIKSACELANKSSKSPLEEDTIAIRESLCAELKSALTEMDPNVAVVNDTAKHVQTFKLKQAAGVNELVLGSAQYEKWTLKEDVALPTKNFMNCLIPLPTGGMAVGCGDGKIEILSSVGELQTTITHHRSICGLACLANHRYAMIDVTNTICLFTSNWNKLPSAFETVSFEEGGYSFLAVDTQDNVHVSYRKIKKILTFPVNGGKAMREIPCNDYEPYIFHVMKSEGFLLVSDTLTVRVINDQGEMKYNLDLEGDRYACPSVCHDGSVIVASVDSTGFLVTIKHYTDQLVHKSTLISDFKIEKTVRGWCQVHELLSGDLAFCTTDRLYIFHK